MSPDQSVSQTPAVKRYYLARRYHPGEGCTLVSPGGSVDVLVTRVEPDAGAVVLSVEGREVTIGEGLSRFVFVGGHAVEVKLRTVGLYRARIVFGAPKSVVFDRLGGPEPGRAA